MRGIVRIAVAAAILAGSTGCAAAQVGGTIVGSLRVLAPADAVEQARAWEAARAAGGAPAAVPGGIEAPCRAAGAPGSRAPGARLSAQDFRLDLAGTDARVIASLTFESASGGALPGSFPWLPCAAAPALDEASCTAPDGSAHEMRVTPKDDRWDFEIPDLGRGKYVVRLVYTQALRDGKIAIVMAEPAPEGAAATATGLVARVPDSGKATFNLTLRSAGEGPGYREFRLSAPSTPAGGLFVMAWDATPGSGGLRGRAILDSGSPAVGAWVTLAPLGSGTFTDADGRFAFENLPAGKYRVNVRQTDCGPTWGDAPVMADKETVIEAIMVRYPKR